LIGGETAEMPGLYQKGHYDLAGFCVGVVEQADMITGKTVQAGDIVIGLSSNGVHSNGFSLVRQILEDHPEIDLNQVDPLLEKTPKDALLMPTRIYVKPVLALTKQVTIKGMAHITGGGFFENLPRMLPSGVGISIKCSQIPIPPVFLWLERLGDLDRMEMYHVFNMGLGMALVVAQEDVELTLSLLEEAGEKPVVAGKIVATPGVFLE
jgi:phosphoribosylformylglycinamidine cyclo-ligase